MSSNYDGIDKALNTENNIVETTACLLYTSDAADE